MTKNEAEEIIVKKMLAVKSKNHATLLHAKNIWARKLKINLPSTASLRRTYLQLVANHEVIASPEWDKILRKRDVRTQSGVAIITVLTKAFPCPGKCIYCPSDARFPKSYLASEPAAQRALIHKFDPYAQVWSRLATLVANGHPVDKLELIVKGGTWSAYTGDYQQWFIRRCFEAANDFPKKQRADRPQNTLLAAQKINESARQRIIGITLETRPDWIRPQTIVQMRVLGATRIELGLQHTDDAILLRVRRGHTLAQTMEALRLLRQAGFKVDVHTMPQLPGSTARKDFLMYQKLFDDYRLRPDMIKIYPCVVLAGTELARQLAAKEFRPYAQKKLEAMLVQVKSEIIPYYCRISRLIRDISSTEILAGNTMTNLREKLQQLLRAQKKSCRCLRCREVGHVLKENLISAQSLRNAKLFVQEYRASDGQEFFLSLENKTRAAVLAFLRLYLPNKTDDAAVQKIHEMLPETADAAFVRELHTYGFLVPIGKKGTAAQHQGLGTRLMAEAEKIATSRGFSQMTVISGVGVRGYYRLLGYRRHGTYMVKSL